MLRRILRQARHIKIYCPKTKSCDRVSVRRIARRELGLRVLPVHDRTTAAASEPRKMLDFGTANIVEHGSDKCEQCSDNNEQRSTAFGQRSG
jgi:hypothetical protein